jgi:hypothetical protein
MPQISTTNSTEVDFPPDVEFIMSALDAGSTSYVGRRASPRVRYRVQATLRLYSDLPGDGPWELFTRDVTPRSLGFVTRHRLPLGYGGTVELHNPDGTISRIECTVLRCREAVTGWFEGAMYFNRTQDKFCAPEDD